MGWSEGVGLIVKLPLVCILLSLCHNIGNFPGLIMEKTNQPDSI